MNACAAPRGALSGSRQLAGPPVRRGALPAAATGRRRRRREIRDRVCEAEENPVRLRDETVESRNVTPRCADMKNAEPPGWLWLPALFQDHEKFVPE